MKLHGTREYFGHSLLSQIDLLLLGTRQTNKVGASSRSQVELYEKICYSRDILNIPYCLLGRDRRTLIQIEFHNIELMESASVSRNDQSMKIE